MQPEGIYDALRYYAGRYPNLPLYVVENGMPTDDGKPRADGYTREAALQDSVFWLQRAKADGMDVIGYNYWSITDNYEWGSYRPRFGLYTVDARTDPSLTRRPTAAVPVYRRTIASPGWGADRAPVLLGRFRPGDRQLVHPVDVHVGLEPHVDGGDGEREGREAA
ncbi:family 1 glycosylhydrolase [Amycolatopsis saalfeldensis]|uniref:Glycosyl hydrolase family 1 n=1 Tax=Amycolatopsis saalfeldensis TaxID=394193 RepID=A0A1H8Y535_9PSEU|nr:Glycosyl hydrolase family 1 [Amycolatopsis saalfeldensis]